jgi:hypothetical protein
MTEEWRDMTDRRTNEFVESTASGGEQAPPSVRLIRDDQAFVVDGRTQSITEL